jgi:hypothetical protein
MMCGSAAALCVAFLFGAAAVALALFGGLSAMKKHKQIYLYQRNETSTSRYMCL